MVDIFQRNVTQLKKYWANLKQQQRDAKTKETQNHMGTGGGPEATPAVIDPTIELVTPHLMARAHCAFTSNLTQESLGKCMHTQAYSFETCNKFVCSRTGGVCNTDSTSFLKE